MKTTTKLIPATRPQRCPTHPGQSWKRILKSLKLSQTEAAQRMGLSRSMLAQITRDKDPLTVSANVAVRFAKLTDTSAELWLNMQAKYDVYVMTQTMQAEIDKIETAFAEAFEQVEGDLEPA